MRSNEEGEVPKSRCSPWTVRLRCRSHTVNPDPPSERRPGTESAFKFAHQRRASSCHQSTSTSISDPHSMCKVVDNVTLAHIKLSTADELEDSGLLLWAGTAADEGSRSRHVHVTNLIASCSGSRGLQRENSLANRGLRKEESKNSEFICGRRRSGGPHQPS